MKRTFAILLVIITFLLGMGLLFYPDFSRWWNSRIQHGLIREYEDILESLDEEEVAEHFRRARIYNNALSGLYIEDPFHIGSGAVLPPAEYMETLNITGMDGYPMGHIEIPVISVHLPIFHTTTMAILDRGIGHIEGTSFPVGGPSTHSVLTGHSGLVHARMFTDLEEVRLGDQFFITILDYRLAYEVDDINIVLPHEIETLRIFEGEDHVTLVTCTPYAINTHRLLVRGRRIPYEPGMAEEIIPRQIEPINWRLVIVAVLVIMFLLILIVYKKKERKDAQELRRARLRKLVVDRGNGQ